MSEPVTAQNTQAKSKENSNDPQIQVTKAQTGPTVSGGGGGGARLPSLDQLAARLNPQSHPAQNSQPANAARSRPPASLLRSVSQLSGASSATTVDSLAVNPPASVRSPSPDIQTPSGLSTVSYPDPEPIPPSSADAPLTSENLEKLNVKEGDATKAIPPAEPAAKKESKFLRGYKNIPSLETITLRMKKTRTLSVDGSAMPSPGGTGLPGIGPDESQLDKIEEFMKQRDIEEQRNSNDHPLQYQWTIYHDSKPRVQPVSASEPWTPPPTAETNAYEAQLTVVGEFKTVESYCRYMNWLKPPSMLERNSNYHLFKEKIKPMWEDDSNAEGGKWVITMRNNPQLLDRCWSYLTMAMVGEELEDADELCGAVVSLRAKVDRIQLWTRSKTDVERLNGIAKKMISLLSVTEADNIGLEFQYHSEDHPPPNKFISMTSSFGFVQGVRTPFVHGQGRGEQQQQQQQQHGNPGRGGFRGGWRQ